MFFQSSASGSVSQATNNTYTLTLNKPSHYVSYFTDRPARKSGNIKIEQFISLWTNKKIKDNFTENPPNVAVSMVLQNEKHQNVIVEVSNPTYANDTLSYQIKTLDNKALQIGNLKHVVLFFDDIHWSSGGF